jgi:hypothetical protein
VETPLEEIEMDAHAFNSADQHVYQMAEILGETLMSLDFKTIRDSLAALTKAMGNGYSVRLRCDVEIVDDERSRTITLLSNDLISQEGNEASSVEQQVWSDAAPEHYLVNGKIQVVPGDCCPECWKWWDCKQERRHCPHCTAVLGENCKLLLVTNACPYCEKGTVTPSNLKCAKCGHTVDPALVVWA